MRRGVEVGIALVVLALVVCPKYEYGLNQPRNWVKFDARSFDQYHEEIDTLSIKSSIENGVQFDIRRPVDRKWAIARDMAEASQRVESIILNCETGIYIIVRKIILNEKGKVVGYDEPTSKFFVFDWNVAQPYANLCKQVGHAPVFLERLAKPLTDESLN